MTRDLEALATKRFDLLVIGAGIYGIAVARDAALRGLAVALIERQDFAAATSSNSLKIVHGGLRYLQRLDLARMRRSIRERRILLATAPHLVRPLPCLLRTRGWGTHSTAALRLALLANDLVGIDRNGTRDPARRLPRGRIVSAGECRRLDPLGDGPAAGGGALWYDAQMTDPDRLAIALLRSAVEAGATVANYVAARALLREADAVAGCEGEDVETGARFPIRARVTVNAAGPWSDDILSLPGGARPARRQPLSTAMNLVLEPRLVGETAVAVEAPAAHRRTPVDHDGTEQVLFLTPWRRGTILGTAHFPFTGEPDAFRPVLAQVAWFLARLRAARPAIPVRLEDITLVHAGLLPAGSGSRLLLDHPRLLDHGRDGAPGLISVVGVKWTTARGVAERVVDAIVERLGRRAHPCRTARACVPGGDTGPIEPFQRAQETEGARGGVDPEAVRRLAARYGTAWRSVVTEAAGDPSCLRPIAPGVETLGVEILHALRHEMARTLADLVRRRTDLGTAGSPGATALAAAGDLAARELGWPPGRLARELDSVQSIYAPLAS